MGVPCAYQLKELNEILLSDIDDKDGVFILNIPDSKIYIQSTLICCNVRGNIRNLDQ